MSYHLIRHSQRHDSGVQNVLGLETVQIYSTEHGVIMDFHIQFIQEVSGKDLHMDHSDLISWVEEVCMRLLSWNLNTFPRRSLNEH